MTSLSGLRVLVIGAHPDDCEAKTGGTTALWRRAGAWVKYISMTDGSRGHHEHGPGEMAAIRRREAAAAARALDIEYDVLEHADGHLEPTLANRLDLIGRIRAARPDLVITHRPDDYHPDHRYTSVLVQDSAFMVTVPNVRPDVPHLRRNPMFAYMEDSFTRPAPFRADVVVGIDDVMDIKLEALAAHESQFYEWLPYNQGVLDKVPPPDDPAARRRWLEAWITPWLLTPGERFHTGREPGAGTELSNAPAFVEIFEISEYGYRPPAPELSLFFPI